MSWGISDTVPIKEKIKAEINDTLNGKNSCGKISYSTYCELYDAFMESLDKMADLKLSDCDDSGFVIYDKTIKVYYCGLKAWSKSLRKAQIYHSEKYVIERLNDFYNELQKCIKDNRLSMSPVKDMNSIVIRKVAIFIEESYSYEDFTKSNLVSESHVKDEKIKKKRKPERRDDLADRNITEISDLAVGDTVLVRKTRVKGTVLHFNPYTDSRYCNYSSVTVQFEKDGKVYKRNYSASSLKKLEDE